MLPDFGWTELLVIAIVLIVVVGPKDLPRVVRGFSKTLGSAKKMAGDFRKQFDEALSDAEMDDLKTLAKDVRSFDPRTKIKDALNPLSQVGQDISKEFKIAANSIEEAASEPEMPVKRNLTPQEAYPQLGKKPEAEPVAEAALEKKAPAKKAASAKAASAKKAEPKAASASKPKTITAKPKMAKVTSSKPATAKPATAKPEAPQKTTTATKTAAKKPASPRIKKPTAGET